MKKIKGQSLTLIESTNPTMTNRINRRKFIIYATTVPMYLFLGASWLRSGRKSLDLFIVDILKKRLDYLIVDDATLFRFAQVVVDNGFNPNRLWKLRGYLYSEYRLFDWALEEYAEVIAAQFLMSSDFFWNGADLSREVKFRAFYDPLRQPCLNPFSDLS